MNSELDYVKGPGFSQDYFLPHLYKFSESFRIIFYDQRCCGHSTGTLTSEQINIDQYVEDLEQLRQNLHLEKFYLLGHSWGGFLAMSYAIKYPQHIEKLVLANSAPCNQEGFFSFFNEYAIRTAHLKDELEKLHSSEAYVNGDPEIVKAYYKLALSTYLYDKNMIKDLSLDMTKESAVNCDKVYALFAKNLFETPFDLRKLLNHLEISTLVIHGDTDPIPPVTAELIHKNIPNSKYVLIKDCGHFPYIETPKLFEKEVTGFLNSK